MTNHPHLTEVATAREAIYRHLEDNPPRDFAQWCRHVRITLDGIEQPDIYDTLVAEMGFDPAERGA